MKNKLMAAALLSIISISALALVQETTPASNSGQIYGSQLMTQQERYMYRAQMSAAKSGEEREQIRKEHHEIMKVRAKELGVILPDDPPAKRGMGQGMGGIGMGSGGQAGR
jgi:hypothetical protein